MEDLRAAIARRFERVAIVHEWLTIPGGSEKVVARMLDLVPQAELFTSVYDPAPWPPAFTERPVHTSFLNRIPGATRRYRQLLPLMNQAFRSFDLSGFDLVISSNHACAKNVRAPGDALHVCYCYTPMRYAWDPAFLEGELGSAARVAARPVVAHLRRVDRRAAAGPDAFVGISHAVAERIRSNYGRSSTVVFPPVEVDRFLGAPREPDDFYLFFGRIVPYKRADEAVQACLRLGRRLKVIGEGRALDRVRELAGGSPDIEFLGYVGDDELPGIMRGARALLFPGEEDFGIVPVEAQAAGVPVVAYGVGGARDTVLDGRTGVLYDEPGVAGLCAAIERFEASSFEDRALREHAATFGPERFLQDFGRVLLETAA
jgi:glycosyltransferase involved in cell wall biosynthesis